MESYSSLDYKHSQIPSPMRLGIPAKTAIQQIAALRQALQYLGVPIRETSSLFGDNESVAKSGTILHSTLTNRRHALAFHFTREAVASKMVAFHHIPGVNNPADILSKHWGHSHLSYAESQHYMYFVYGGKQAQIWCHGSRQCPRRTTTGHLL